MALAKASALLLSTMCSCERSGSRVGPCRGRNSIAAGIKVRRSLGTNVKRDGRGIFAPVKRDATHTVVVTVRHGPPVHPGWCSPGVFEFVFQRGNTVEERVHSFLKLLGSPPLEQGGYQDLAVLSLKLRGTNPFTFSHMAVFGFPCSGISKCMVVQTQRIIVVR
jgi:hypothetical protein